MPAERPLPGWTRNPAYGMYEKNYINAKGSVAPYMGAWSAELFPKRPLRTQDPRRKSWAHRGYASATDAMRAADQAYRDRFMGESMQVSQEFRRELTVELRRMLEAGPDARTAKTLTDAKDALASASAGLQRAGHTVAPDSRSRLQQAVRLLGQVIGIVAAVESDTLMATTGRGYR